MIPRTTITYGGLALLVCLACVLPVVALDLNPLSFIQQKKIEPTKAPIAVRNVSAGTQHLATVTPVVQHSAAAANVHSATTPANTITTVRGTITEVDWDAYGTIGAIMRLENGNEILLLSYPSPDDRLYGMFETAYIKGNKVQITGYSKGTMSWTGYNVIKNYDYWQVLTLQLGPVPGS